MLKRIITGAIMLGVLLPLILIQNRYVEVAYCALGMFMTFVGTYEFTNALYKKNENLKLYRIITPILSSLLTFLVFNATYHLHDLQYQLYAILFFIFGVCLILILILVIETVWPDSHLRHLTVRQSRFLRPIKRLTL